MKTLEDLTPEIREKIPEYKEKCTRDLYSGVEHANFNRKMSVEYVQKIYELTGREKPVVIFADDPADYKRKFIFLQDEEVQNLVAKIFEEKNAKDVTDWDYELEEKRVFESLDSVDIDIEKNNIEVKSHYLFLCSSYHRVYLMWYKFIQDEFKIDHSNIETLNWLYENANNNISRCYFTTNYVLVLKMPQYIRRNSVGFHHTTEGAIVWGNYNMYYINGRKMPEDIFLKVVKDEFTFKEFIKLDNEDIKAGIITMIKENHGDAKLMEFLNAKVIDEKTIKHSSGHNEVVKIWHTNEKFSFLNDINGKENQPYAWLELTCPSTGSMFLIDTSAHFTDAVEACKFHRPQFVPAELEYDFKEFNN